MAEQNVEVKALCGVRFDKKLYKEGELISLPSSLAEALSERGAGKNPAVTILSFMEADPTPVTIEIDLDFLDVKDEIKEVLVEAKMTDLEILKSVTKKELEDLPKIGEATAKSIVKQVAEA